MNEKLETMLMGKMEAEIQELDAKNLSPEKYRQEVAVIVQAYLKTFKDCGFTLEDKRKDHITTYLKMGVEVLGITLPLIFYGRWMRKGLEFEQNGAFTSSTFRGLIGKFRTTK